MRPSKPMPIFFCIAVLFLFTVILGACSSVRPVEDKVAAVRFIDYQTETIQQIRAVRHFQLPEIESELVWNSPQEWRPTTDGNDIKPQKGILLVHGLGDSPWSFHDIAQTLAHRGFLVRTVLLPGHGTRPEDLLTVRAEQWQKIVQQQVLALENDVTGQVYLGGFSTGANLVLEYAYAHPNIAGLVLFSPGFKSVSFDWLAPLVSYIRPWVIKPNENALMQTPVRYMNIPTNGFAQYYRTSVVARELVQRPYNKPVFMVVAQHDSVLDTNYLLETFQHSFTHPQSRLIWYGENPKGLKDTERIFIRTDKVPELHISQFSHMGVLFSPANSLYGINGTLRICRNSMSEKKTNACEHESQVWYSDWGYHEEGKIHARLTFNPYFDWQTALMLETLSKTEPLDEASFFQNQHRCYFTALACEE